MSSAVKRISARRARARRMRAVESFLCDEMLTIVACAAGFGGIVGTLICVACGWIQT